MSRDETVAAPPSCRFCRTPLRHTFCDLGMSPLSNRFLRADQLQQMEPFYPLHVYVCSGCHLVQLEEFQRPEEIFSDYAYFSSYSDTWIAHAERYAERMISRFGFDARSQIIEVASNDGYLLKHFRKHGIPVLGIEPAVNVARTAEAAGIPTLARFFGMRTAQELSEAGTRADLLIGNNVLAHVPDINDFVRGLKALLKPRGILTMEFPHLEQLMDNNQFDTIYHEHFSYLSFHAVERIFTSHGLALFDVEELPTHGGSLRIYAQHTGEGDHPVTPVVAALRGRELQGGVADLVTYTKFQQQVWATKRDLLAFLINARREGKTVAGYGAPAKGNTLLNFCGIRADLVEYTVDRNPHKQGRFLPGTHIPIHHPDRIRETRPDYLLILPWNLKEEIVRQMADVRSWGARFVVPIPHLEVSA